LENWSLRRGGHNRRFDCIIIIVRLVKKNVKNLKIKVTIYITEYLVFILSLFKNYCSWFLRLAEIQDKRITVIIIILKY